MKPSDRIKHITAIAKSLEGEDWSLIDFTLKQFSLRWRDSWSGDKNSYVLEMLGEAPDDSLLELGKHLGTASTLESPDAPKFWSEENPRIFISHLSTEKEETGQIRNELAKYGITAFVAHDDIEPTKEWQKEIESALATMDGLVALLSPGFNESRWCDQEIGVAIGRRLPIISVKRGLDPYGFIGKYQALNGGGKTSAQIARDIFDLLIVDPQIGPKITSKLVQMLCNAATYKESRDSIDLVERSNFLTSKHAAAMKEAVKENSQVRGSWGVPDRIEKIVLAVKS